MSKRRFVAGLSLIKPPEITQGASLGIKRYGMVRSCRKHGLASLKRLCGASKCQSAQGKAKPGARRFSGSLESLLPDTFR